MRVLGQNEKVLEYRPEVTPKTEWEQTAAGLRITAYRAQRLYNDRRWPNPVVLKITNVTPGLQPPVVQTLTETSWDGGGAVLRAELKALGDAKTVRVGFEYRRKKSTAEMYEEDDPWQVVGKKLTPMSAPGEFSAKLPRVDPKSSWEYRALVDHPKVRLYGQAATLAAR